MEYFNRYPKGDAITEDYSGMNIGLAISGGTDSALLLYLLAKMVSDRNLSSDIICIHGIDTNMKIAVSKPLVEKIIEYVRNKFPNVNIILKIFYYAIDPDILNKNDYHQPYYDDYMKLYNIPKIIRAITQGMPNSGRPIVDHDISPEKLTMYSQDDITVPFGAVDKRWVKLQYRYHGIMDLANMTVSCISDQTTPCRTCWWCKERFWAFGNYDGGIQ